LSRGVTHWNIAWGILFFWVTNVFNWFFNWFFNRFNNRFRRRRRS